MKGFQELEKKVNSTVENLLETKFRELTGKMVLASGEKGGEHAQDQPEEQSLPTR